MWLHLLLLQVSAVHLARPCCNALLLMSVGMLQDYYNLVDVYLDAVLQPRCVTDPKTFAQEGWHYELDDVKVSVCLSN